MSERKLSKTRQRIKDKRGNGSHDLTGGQSIQPRVPTTREKPRILLDNSRDALVLILEICAKLRRQTVVAQQTDQ